MEGWPRPRAQSRRPALEAVSQLIHATHEVAEHAGERIGTQRGEPTVLPDAAETLRRAFECVCCPGEELLLEAGSRLQGGSRDLARRSGRELLDLHGHGT